MKHYPIKVTLQDKLGKRFSFESLASLVEFVDNELKYWIKVKETINDNRGQLASFANCANHFRQISTTIKEWDSNIDSWSEQELQQNLNNQLINSQLNYIHHNWIWSGHTVVPKLIEIHNNLGQEVSDSFVNSIVGNVINHGNKKQFIGAVLAYEFELQEKSLLGKRRKSEQKSLEELRSNLVAQHIALTEDIKATKSDFSDWSDSCKQKSKRIRKSNYLLARKQRANLSNKFYEELANWQKDFTKLEDTYRDKLRLDGPAQYWKNSAIKFKKQGIVWAVFLLIVLCIGLWQFSSFFNQWLIGKELNIELNTMQGAAIFVTIVSSFAFLVSVLAKMTLSSFHLQRDAEEREQLTHLYLSLSNETDVDPETRKIVLQSLFSRADTGLLGKDGGTPAMPFIGDVFRNK